MVTRYKPHPHTSRPRRCATTRRFVGKYFVVLFSTTKTTKILPLENYPLYGTSLAMVAVSTVEYVLLSSHTVLVDGREAEMPNTTLSSGTRGDRGSLGAPGDIRDDSCRWKGEVKGENTCMYIHGNTCAHVHVYGAQTAEFPR